MLSDAMSSGAMSSVSVTLRCTGCAALVDPLDPVRGGPTAGFRCPNAERAPRIDHVLAWEPHTNGVTRWPTDPTINPFIRYRTLHHSYWLARARGITDQQYVDRVGRLDQAIAAVDGRGFTITPFDVSDSASDALGVRVWAKDETGNVAGSHKGRHLMGLAIHLDVEKVPVSKRLAIASCGNAALAAATIAKAARRPVDVFVPSDAKPAVLARLEALGAGLNRMERTPDSPPGDPCVHGFHAALGRGALPFCVQGNENGLTIDGGSTIGHELVDQFSVVGLRPSRLVVHCGGGAFGSSLVRGLGHGVHLGVIQPMPPVHIVQADGAAPLRRAWAAVANRALAALDEHDLRADGLTYDDHAMDALVAERLTRPDAVDAVTQALQFAVANRSSHMWTWEEVPSSVAGGILDDETYDWFSLVGAMICTAGWPVVVDDATLLEANKISGSAADETGTAGLAGVVALRRAGQIADDEDVVCVYSGIRRAPAPAS
jgi:threonine synthase